MNLGRKAVLVAGVTLFLVVLTILVFTVPVLMRGFNGLEADFVLLNVERVQRALAAEIDRLHVAAGDWAGWDLNVALWTDGAWLRLPPRTGWLAWVEDEGLLLVYDGATWIGTTPAALRETF